MAASSNEANPVLVEVLRGGVVESRHRGSWVLTDGDGTVLDGAGDWDTPVYARSSIKALQALPLLETGAAERFGFDDADVALAVSSHNGEPCHTERAAAILARLDLSEDDLRCGVQSPGDSEARASLRRDGASATALHNNCSGKHAGFLALTQHLGAPTEAYLDPSSPTQLAVRAAVGEMCGLDPAELSFGVDGCSAPTWLLPLRALGRAFARLATSQDLLPERTAACRRIMEAVAGHPVLIAGSRKRICTDLCRESGGRLFPKIGAEGVYVIGVRGADRGLAVKLDDGQPRGLHATVMALLDKLGLADDAELARLGAWGKREIINCAGLTVGRIEVHLS